MEVEAGQRTAPIWKCRFFPSEVNEKQLVDWHRMYSVPGEIEFIVPGPNDQADDPPLGCVALNQAVLAAGLRLPFPRIVRKFLREWGIAPTQLCPNGWRILLGFLILWDQFWFPHPSVGEFNSLWLPRPRTRSKIGNNFGSMSERTDNRGELGFSPAFVYDYDLEGERKSNAELKAALEKSADKDEAVAEFRSSNAYLAEQEVVYFLTMEELIETTSEKRPDWDVQFLRDELSDLKRKSTLNPPSPEEVESDQAGAEE
ncbi:Uncharacterized protein Adt_02210 [Abeliophyllum distichum]|uniref:Transposase (putative) gypsy type domain-containing protein n=1 Tax=Abeliophyllum distichum TaxID=126358 RepID=A0ABD1VV81_9LAMI